MAHIPNEENITFQSKEKVTYSYIDENGDDIFTTKTIYKDINRIVAFPYSYSLRNQEVSTKRVKEIEFRGWRSLKSIPNDFRRSNNVIALRSRRLRYLLSYLYPKFPHFDKLITGPTAQNRFTKKTISINWSDLEKLLKNIAREKYYFDQSRKSVIHNGVAGITSLINSKPREIRAGQLKYFLDKFQDLSRLNDSDYEALSEVLEELPNQKIQITANFIKTKERINIAFLENIISEYEYLLEKFPNSEKKWQDYLDKYAWILENLFPYKVYLRKREAYVGGKTFENIDGSIVDFLMQNGFDDNYALVEIKTPGSGLLKGTSYRKPNVFPMADSLSGGINQCLAQKNTFLSEFGKSEKILDPKTILIIGLKEDLDDNQKSCFELLRANQSSVDIVTFDELLAKLRGLLTVLKN